MPNTTPARIKTNDGNDQRLLPSSSQMPFVPCPCPPHQCCRVCQQSQLQRNQLPATRPHSKTATTANNRRNRSASSFSLPASRFSLPALRCLSYRVPALRTNVVELVNSANSKSEEHTS